MKKPSNDSPFEYFWEKKPFHFDCLKVPSVTPKTLFLKIPTYLARPNNFPYSQYPSSICRPSLESKIPKPFGYFSLLISPK